MSAPLKVLFLAGDPTDGEASLRVDREIRDVRDAVRQEHGPLALDIAFELAARASELQAALRRHRPVVVHFSGHGAQRGGIFLDDGLVTGPALVHVFRLFGHVRAVVLNACDTLPVADALVRVVDYAVGMSKPIHDEASLAFSTELYGALASGETVPNAFASGVNQLRLLSLRGVGTPQLRARKGVTHAPLVTPRPAGAGDRSGNLNVNALGEVEAGGPVEFVNVDGSDEGEHGDASTQINQAARLKTHGSLSFINRRRR